jgi:hypothetical protein
MVIVTPVCLLAGMIAAMCLAYEEIALMLGGGLAFYAVGEKNGKNGAKYQNSDTGGGSVTASFDVEAPASV